LEFDPVPIEELTLIFLVIVLLAATQDIAVDALGLDLFEPEMRYRASLSQTVGMNLGHFISQTLFLSLNSVEFCNSFIRTVPHSEPILKLGGYLWFWGIVYLILTILLLFKKEDKSLSSSLEHPDLSIKQVYTELLSILKLKHIKILIAILLTAKIGILAINPLFPVRLAELTFPQHLFAFSSAINFVIQLITTYILSDKLNTPLDLWYFGYRAQLIMCPVILIVIALYPHKLNLPYILLVFLTSGLITIFNSIMFTTSSAFYTRISDARIGGTYLTLLYTITNLGNTWPNFFVYYLVDLFTIRNCPPGISSHKHEGECQVPVHGFYVIGGSGILLGIIFLYYVKKFYLPLQHVSSQDWLIQIL